MTDDPSSLDNLRPEVAHSVRCVDAEPFSDGAIMHWPVVRAELRRLAADNVRLRGTPVPKVEWQELTERAERAEAELAAAHHERDRMFLDAREWATRFGEMEARAERAEAELAESRETIKRLNRRAQLAEAGVVEKVKEHAGGSLGRELANAAADMYMRERDEAQAELAALKARIANSCRADGQRVFDLLGLPIEYDGTLALVKVEG